MRDYVGTRFTLKEFVNNDTNYLNTFNVSTIEALANMSFTSAPINGGTEILAGSITGDRIVDGTITSGKLAAAASVTQLANNTYLDGTTTGAAVAHMIKIGTNNTLVHGTNWEALNLANNKVLGGTTSGASAQDWMKTSSTDKWTFLSTCYPQSMLPSTTNTYVSGNSSNYWASITTANAYIGDYSYSNKFYVDGTTFTPTLTVNGSSTGITYSSNAGKYWRVGPLVYFLINVILTSKGAGTGQVKLAGLPITAGAQISGSTQVGGVTFNDGGNITFTANYTAVAAQVDAGQATISLVQIASGASSASSALANTNINNTSYFCVSGWYTTV